MAILIKGKGKIRTQEEKSWDDLVEQIWEGNVIPVIGDNFVVEGTTIAQELIEYLAEDKGVKSSPKNFSELYYDEDFKKHQAAVYEEVSSLIEANQSEFQPTSILKDFLSIRQFPFVITTSVDYTVEETMKAIWAERNRKVKSLVFSNNPDENDDIKSYEDIQEPTVYYMFGKANNIREHSFVLTEEDMLSFCQSWLSSDKHPALLSKVIAGKYLLFLGVNYPDWLIRFVWYSMRNNLGNSGMLVDNRDIENSLLNFFQRVSIRTQKAPQTVYQEIKTRLDNKTREYELKKFDSVAENTDFFISYSRRDKEWTEILYTELTARGYNVWYDKRNISCGSEWDVAIRRGIRTSKRFIALLSDNIADESYEHHTYRTEWDVALAYRMNDINFVKPICIGNSNIYKDLRMKLPEDMLTMHAPTWAEKENVSEIIESIISNSI